MFVLYEPLLATGATTDGATVLPAVVRRDEADHDDQNHRRYAERNNESVEFLLALWAATCKWNLINCCFNIS